MSRSVFRRVIVDSKSNARGSFVINPNGYAAAANTSVKRLLLQFQIEGSQLQIADLETFGLGTIITARYRDGSPLCEAVNASLLDFRAAAFRSGDNSAGLGDFAAPNGTAAAQSAIKLNLWLEFTDPRRREANDVSVPLAEIGQFNVQVNTSNITIGNGGSLDNITCTMYAHCVDEKEPVLGLRPVYALQNLQGQSTTWDNGGRILRAIDAYATTSSTLVTDISNGFQLFCDGDLTVDGSTIPSLEEFNAEFGEPHYKAVSTLAAQGSNGDTAGGYGYSEALWAAGTKHARVFDIMEDVSATELQSVSKCRFQVNAPGAGINGVQLLITAYEPQTAESIQRRKQALGLALATVEPAVSDTIPGQVLSATQKQALPAKVGGR